MKTRTKYIAEKRIEWPGAVRCGDCKEVLVSNYVHDFVCCNCANGTFVDGGKAYHRYGGKDLKKVQLLKLSIMFKRINK